MPGNHLNEAEEEMVVQLRQQLIEKESALTECRLEALTSAHQLDHVKEQMNKYRVRRRIRSQQRYKFSLQSSYFQRSA